MNQRQAIPKPRNTRNVNRNGGQQANSLPPVLFSLPDLTVPSVSPEPKTAYQAAFAQQFDPGSETVVVEKPKSQRHDRSTEKSGSLLNTAIGFLAFALLLIGVKLYTDRVSERSRASQHTSASMQVALPKSPARNPKEPESFNAAAQRANFQMPVVPKVNPSVNNPLDSQGKAVLEISDPVVSASYPSDPVELESAAMESTLASNPVSTASAVAFPTHAASLPSAITNSLPATLPTALPVALPVALPATAIPSEMAPNIESPKVQHVEPTSRATQMAPMSTQPNAIPASSLNTRDMILLRQGKSIDLNAKDRDSKTVSLPVKTAPDPAMKLTGETYPPVRNRYEPIGIPPATPTVSNPTSIQIPEPPKPYQPIGTQFE